MTVLIKNSDNDKEDPLVFFDFNRSDCFIYDNRLFRETHVNGVTSYYCFDENEIYSYEEMKEIGRACNPPSLEAKRVDIILEIVK